MLGSTNIVEITVENFQAEVGEKLEQQIQTIPFRMERLFPLTK